MTDREQKAAAKTFAEEWKDKGYEKGQSQPFWLSLSKLYDENFMPPELRRAHQLNDKAVMEAYGFTRNTDAYKSESACVAALIKLYKEKTQG